MVRQQNFLVDSLVELCLVSGGTGARLMRDGYALSHLLIIAFSALVLRDNRDMGVSIRSLFTIQPAHQRRRIRFLHSSLLFNEDRKSAALA